MFYACPFLNEIGFFDTRAGNLILGPWRETGKMIDSTI